LSSIVTFSPVRDISGGLSASHGLQRPQGAPAPPQLQASKRLLNVQGRSGCASHTQPVSSQIVHFAVMLDVLKLKVPAASLGRPSAPRNVPRRQLPADQIGGHSVDLCHGGQHPRLMNAGELGGFAGLELVERLDDGGAEKFSFV
jgi:hypothetical protein